MYTSLLLKMAFVNCREKYTVYYNGGGDNRICQIMTNKAFSKNSARIVKH